MSDYATRDTYNLDLTEVATSDHVRLASEIEIFYNTDSSTKLQLSYNWERNHLMLDGKQWITYNREEQTGRLWSEVNVSRSNEFIPRPVTNYLFDVYQTLKSYLVQNRPRSSVRPNTHTIEDKVAARVAEMVSECNWERLKEEQNYEYAASCGLVYGTVFKKDYWDTTAPTMATVPKMEERPVISPVTGLPTGESEMVEAIDEETGSIMTEEVPLGDVNTEIVEPYRIALDPLAGDLHTARWVMEYSIQPLNWIRDMYDGKKGKGYTGKAKDVKEETNLSESLRRFYELRTSSGIRYFGQGFYGTAGDGSTDQMVSNAAVVKEYYERPSQKHPQGRLIVVANGVTLYAGDSPINGSDIDDWHPYSEFRWEVFPGRFWGRSPLDDASEIQKRINSVDATIVLTRKTMAIPQKLIPKGSGIRKGEWTGRPGQQIEYRVAEGVKPETISPAGVDAQVFQERAQLVSDMKQITGAMDILRGDRPPSVSAASALELLHETATGKLRPALDRWKKFIETSQKKQLKLVANNYTEPRESFIRLLKERNKSFSDNVLDKFIGEDLRDNCNVKIEAGSNIPKLIAAEKAQLLQAAQLGVLKLENEENRIKFLDKMGIRGFGGSPSADVSRSEEENLHLNALAMNPDNRPIVLDVDDHQIHIEIHKRAMKEPAYLEADQVVQEAYLRHIAEHQEKIDEAQHKQQMEAMAMGQQPPAPEDAGMPKSKLKARGKGVSEEVQQQITAPDIPS